MRAQLTYVFATVIMAVIAIGAPARPGQAQTPEITALAQTITSVETKLGARIGVVISDSSSGWKWGYKQHQRFLMTSTFKPLLCGAVLDRISDSPRTLDDRVHVRPDAVLAYAPVTKAQVGHTMTLAALCEATLDKSDNTAANLLLEWLGGPREVTRFLRTIGDTKTRLDRWEPQLNSFSPDDPRDTTTPASMVSTWANLLQGGALEPVAAEHLRQWMSKGGVTAKLIRPSIPSNWRVADKSGGGRDHTRALVAMITPPDRHAYFVAIYVSDTLADWANRNAAIRQVGAAVVKVIKAR